MSEPRPSLPRRIAQGTGYWLYQGTAKLVQILPARLTYAGAVLSGELTYLAWANRRRITKANFAVVLGKSEDHPDVARVARRTFRNFAKYVTEIMRFPKLDLDDFARLVRLQGWEHLKEGLSRNRGVIFVSIHFGNFDLGGARIANDVKVNVIADDLTNQRLMDLIVGNRTHKNITIHSPVGAAKKVLGALRRNEMVGLMMDLGPRADAFGTVQVNFFGIPTKFPSVAANLARVSGAPILVTAVVRELDNTFSGIALPLIVVDRTREAAQDIEDATQAIVAGLERFIREWPDQWYIFRPMWPAPTRP